MKNKYKALLFHPDGDYVTDFRDRDTIEEVWDEIADMGSRWFFYPLCFVATDKTIADAPDQLRGMKGKRISTIQKYFRDTWKGRADEISETINEGFPLYHVYPEYSPI